MQGPTVKRSLTFRLGEEINVRFRGEDEFFPLRIKQLYPEAGAILLGENLIKLSDIAAIRFENRKTLKDYLRVQGLVNVVIISIAALADEQVRMRQRGFITGAAVVSGAMFAYGTVGRYKTRLVGQGKPYLLVVGGGVPPAEVERDGGRRY